MNRWVRIRRDGAILDYHLAKSAADATIEILDAKGVVVRRYSSSDQPDQTEAQLKEQIIPLYWIRKHKALSTTAGMHRWVWDLRYATPLAPHYDYPISAVPHDTPTNAAGAAGVAWELHRAVDGRRTRYTAPLVVKMDPRVTTPLAGLQQQFDLQHHLASLLSTSSEAVVQARSIREQIKTILPQASGSTKDSLQQFDSKIKVVSDGPEKPVPGTEGSDAQRCQRSCEYPLRRG